MTTPASNPHSLDLKNVVKESVSAAQSAGEILLDRFGRLRSEHIQKKDAFDFVTDADTAAESAIIAHLQKCYPDHNIHAEESGRSATISEYQWLIDPLDGTKNYIHGLPIYAVSIGLRHRDDVVAATVLIPSLGELFTAIRGQGAFLNGEPIRVSQQGDMAAAMLATGFPHAAKEHLDLYLECFRRLFLRVSAIRRPGACAVDLAYIACGRFDGFFEFKLNPWDMGAGLLLIEEAGGRISDPTGGGNYFATGDLVAGNPAIHQHLVAELAPLCSGRLGWKS